MDNFPIFTHIDPPEFMAFYLDSCAEECIDPLVDSFNLPETYPYAYGKRKKEARGEGSYGSQKKKKKKKVVAFLDEDEVPLNERQKAMVLKDTSGIVQQSSKASEASIPGKSSTARNLCVSISHNSESLTNITISISLHFHYSNPTTTSHKFNSYRTCYRNSYSF